MGATHRIIHVERCVHWTGFHVDTKGGRDHCIGDGRGRCMLEPSTSALAWKDVAKWLDTVQTLKK